jgi:hypothetical protein
LKASLAKHIPLAKGFHLMTSKLSEGTEVVEKIEEAAWC